MHVSTFLQEIEQVLSIGQFNQIQTVIIIYLILNVYFNVTMEATSGLVCSVAYCIT